MKNLLLISLILLTNCGVQVKGIPSAIHETVGPDLVGAGAFCDSRYGAGTAASEACFQDYMNYTKIVVSINLNGISSFCDAQYADPTQQSACVTDLLTFLGNSTPKPTPPAP